METPRRLESIKAINKAAQNAGSVRYTHFVQDGNDFERKEEVEILRSEAVEKLEEMKDKEYMIKQHLSDDYRYLENEEIYLNSLIELAKQSSVIRLYNMIRVDLEHGQVKYILQYKLQDNVLTYEVIERTTLEQTRAIKQKRAVIQMDKQEIIEGLESLIADREALIEDETDNTDIFVKDKMVLEEAIKKIEKSKEGGING